MSSPIFVDTDRGEWGIVGLTYIQRGQLWNAKLSVLTPNPEDSSSIGWLQFHTQARDPEVAVAELERAIVETLAQGGQLVERRAKNQVGRRAYDNGSKHALGWVEMGMDRRKSS